MAERTAGVYDRSIDVQISRLRAKLHDNARNPDLIRTMRGDGYMLTVPVSRSAP
jgi:two-component system OmpR family response regulator